MNQLTRHASHDIQRSPDMDLFGSRVGEVAGTTFTLILAIAAWAALVVFLIALS